MVFIEALHIKTPICASTPISNNTIDKLAIFTNYSDKCNQDHALEETVLTLFHPVVHSYFQLVGVTIEDTIACHNAVEG